MGPQDSVDLALAAVAELVHGRGRTDCSFAFVGTGDALPALRRQAADLGISDYVSFPGWATEREVLDFLGTADLGLEPNTEDYISPVKVMEYMTEGLPVVAFETQETVRLAADAARYVPRRDSAAMAALVDELLDSRADQDPDGPGLRGAHAQIHRLGAPGGQVPRCLPRAGQRDRGVRPAAAPQWSDGYRWIGGVIHEGDT